MQKEFSIEQIRNFVSKGFPSVAARMTKELLAMYDQETKPRPVPTTSEGVIIAHERFAFAIRNIKTLDGCAANYVVVVTGEAVLITKRILSFDKIDNMKMLRLTKWGKLYEQVMAVKLNTLAQISFEVFEQLRNQVQQK